MSIFSDILGYKTLGDDVNKLKNNSDDEKTQGIASEKLPELSLEMKDEDIIKLTTKVEKKWEESPKKQKWEKQIEDNLKYYYGEQKRNIDAKEDRPMIDNLLFEAVETFLPQATRRNPEPIVELHSSEMNEDGQDEDPVKIKYLSKVKNTLADIADEDKLRLKIKKVARHWTISQLGVGKTGWDLDRDMPILRVIRPNNMILDPDAVSDEGGYSGEFIGERRKLPAWRIIKMIENSPEAKGGVQVIEDLVKGDTGTEIKFIEWWTNEYMCWTLGKKVLVKRKNPHWNYDKTETPDINDLASPGVKVDAYGNATVEPIEIKGINHFYTPKKPYVFLTVFNLGDQPMDNTGLINQNLSNQDAIDKRNYQIDANIDDMNGGVVVSLGRAGLTQSQAEKIPSTLRKKGAVAIPDGTPAEAINRFPAPGLPPDVYGELNDKRSSLRNIFGIKGSSQAGLETEDTVRGKIVGRGLDSDRIGGGVTEYLEQFADDVYNWFVQLLYVYDSRFQFLEGGRPPKIVVSVKEGSLLPKDSTTIANQALELARMNRISNLDLFKTLEYPNYEEMAANIWLETNAPDRLYKNNPEIQQIVQEKQQVQMMEMEAKKQAEMEKMQMEGEIDIAKEQVKNRGETTRSIISQIPTS